MVEKATIFSNFGETAVMDAVDARRALQQHPGEWSTTPFSDSAIKKGKADKADREAKEKAILAADKAGTATTVTIDPTTLDAAVKAELDRRAKAAEDARTSAPGAAAPFDEDAAKAELSKKKDTELLDIAEAEHVVIEGADNKSAIIAKIVGARKAAAAQA